MKRFILALGILCAMALPAVAADITHWGKNLFIVGQIDDQDYDKFYNIIVEHGDEIKDVWMTSIGGSFNDGLLIGADIKILGLNTIVVDRCFSACAFMWLAGDTRKVFEFSPEDLTYIAIHMPGMVADPTAVIPNWLLQKTSWYLDLVGIPEIAKGAILATPNTSTLYLSPARMQEWGIEASRLE